MNRYLVYNEVARCIVITEDCAAEVSEFVRYFKPKDSEHLMSFLGQEVGYDVEEVSDENFDETIVIGANYSKPTCIYCSSEITYEQYATGGMCSRCMDDKIQEYERQWTEIETDHD